jgi:hypothetical protein
VYFAKCKAKQNIWVRLRVTPALLRATLTLASPYATLFASPAARLSLAGSILQEEQKNTQANTSTAAELRKNGSHDPVFRTMSSASKGEITPGRLATVLPSPVRIPVSYIHRCSKRTLVKRGVSHLFRMARAARLACWPDATKQQLVLVLTFPPTSK